MPSLADAERVHIVRVLDAVGWNKKEAARVLEISRGTLYRKIAEYRLEPGERPKAVHRRGMEALEPFRP
jgi:DNA-binding NtrC family response regulator